jgi:hypothetical protein
VANDAKITRELILDNLRETTSADAFNIIRVLIAELTVISLHGADSLASIASTSSVPTEGNDTGGKLSRLGTVSLPRAVYDTKIDADDSGSDIPSESTGSSDDEMVLHPLLSLLGPLITIIDTFHYLIER